MAKKGSRSAKPSPGAERPDVSANTAYEVLGVEPMADNATLKKRYHQIARHWHPDVSTQEDAQEVFAHVLRSYNLLTDPQARVVYDFCLSNNVPIGKPEQFLDKYHNNAFKHRVGFLVGWRHHIAWAITGSVFAAIAGLRLVQQVRANRAAGNVRSDADAHSTARASASSSTSTPASASASAMGGMYGGIVGGGLLTSAVGLSGGLGARWGLVAAMGGTLVGRSWLHSIDSRFHLKSLESRPAHLLVAYGRPACELLSAAMGVLLLRRASPGVHLREQHLRVLQAGGLGAASGHLLGRLACRQNEVDAARHHVVVS